MQIEKATFTTPHNGTASTQENNALKTDETTFLHLYCDRNGIDEKRFITHLLRRTLFLHYTLLSPVILVVMPNWLFAERRLLYQISKVQTLSKLQVDIDFYQHKYVVNSVWRGPFRFRLSGQKLMSIAKRLSLPLS